MTLNNYYIICLLLIKILLINKNNGDYTMYDCPAGWEEFADHCYRFVIDNNVDRTTATALCKEDSGFVLSVNSDLEHSFILGELEKYDTGSTRRNWWTSGRREGVSMEFFWEGDGKKIESYFYWHDPSIPENLDYDYIIYNYNGFEWGWILDEASVELSYICKVSKEDIFMINYRERGPDYGLENPDPETVPRGPKFTVIPEDTIYEEYNYEPLAVWYNPFSDRSETEQVELNCEADGYPLPVYTWYKEAGGKIEEVDLEASKRYTLINGRLIIHSPSADDNDEGKYRCLAQNDFGVIMSPWVTLQFGYLGDFSNNIRKPIETPEFMFATIPCYAPEAFPPVVYAWYKTDIRNFVRTDLKPHMFISWDGNLYFSSVTLDDENEYFCLVNKPGRVLTSGKRSQAIALRVKTGNPGNYDPQIGGSFPKMFPTDAKVGDNLRLECLAFGTAETESRPLMYNWEKIVHDKDGEEVIEPLPKQHRMTDHNRILNIPDAQTYDQGTYKCTVTKPSGVSGHTVSKTLAVNLNAEPYFVSPLTDKFLDINTDLIWVCEAVGNPAVDYNWYKNGIQYTQGSVPPDHQSRITITNNRVEIRSVQPYDDGMYQCEAVNSHGSNFSSAEMRVLSFAPTFTHLSVQEHMQATDGGNMTIFCQPEAAPQPEITWRKDGSLLNPGNQEGDRIRQMPNGNLFISPVQYGDAGVYRCDATNEHGSANSTGTLTVLEEVTMAQYPEAQVVTLNKTTFMACQASHNPHMDVTYVWYQGDMMIIFMKVYRLGENRYETWYDPHFRAGTGIFMGGLYIMNAQFWHKGRYTCRIESSGSVIERYADLEIMGPPSEPAGVMIVDGSVNATAAKIQWKASHSNGAPILSFVIEALNLREGFWRVIRTNIMPPKDQFDTYFYTVNDLRPYSWYRIRVKAENRLGTSVPSTPSEEFGTLAVKPDLYPDMIGGGGGKVGDLTITWEPLPPWEENGPGIGYRIYWKFKGDDEFPVNRIVEVMGSGVGHHTILVGQDDYYKEYDILVQAFNDIGDGPLPPLVVVRSAMGMPDIAAANVKAWPYNSTACVVTWDPVPDTRTSVKGKLGGYKVGFWKASIGAIFGMPERVTLNGQVSEGMVIGLEPDTRYYFNVYVWTDAGTGPKSTYFEQITLRQAPVNQPTEVRVKKVDDESVWVWWRGVSTDQTEEPLEGYMVRIWREGEHIKNATDYDARKDTTLTVRGLLPLEAYKLRVFGYSRGGWGTMSSPAVRFTLADGASALQTSLPVLLFCVFGVLIKNFVHQNT